MRSVNAHWVVGFNQKQWLAEEVFWNIIHIQIYTWTKYALCESTVSGGLQAEAMGFRRSFWKPYKLSNIQLNEVCAPRKYSEWWPSSRSNEFQKNFSKQYTHSNIQLNKLCAPRKYSEWWPSSRSNGFQEKFFKTVYIFKHTIEQGMRSVKVLWVVDFKQKQWVAEEFFWNIIHMQTYNWTKYALCGSTLSVWLQAEGMVSRRIFSKHFTYSNIQVDKICTLWKNSECWASRTSKAFLKKFFKTIYTFKHAIEQWMRSVRVHWAVGFRQKQWLAEVVF